MYSSEEWQSVTQSYTERLLGIKIPEDASPVVILQLQSQLDEIFTELQLDYGKIKGEYNRLKNAVKRLSSVYYLEVKDQGKTEKERDSLAQKLIMEKHRYGDMSIIEAMELAEEELVFLQSAIDIVQEKTNRLITILGSLKLEQSIGALEYSTHACRKGINVV